MSWPERVRSVYTCSRQYSADVSEYLQTTHIILAFKRTSSNHRHKHTALAKLRKPILLTGVSIIGVAEFPQASQLFPYIPNKLSDLALCSFTVDLTEVCCAEFSQICSSGPPSLAWSRIYQCQVNTAADTKTLPCPCSLHKGRHASIQCALNGC